MKLALDEEMSVNSSICKCEAGNSTALRFKHAFTGIFRTVLAVIIPGLLFAVLWGVVDFLQKYNSVQPPPLWLPFTAKYQQINAGQQMSDFDKLVDLYNIMFPGACRFGSGIGMVLGGFWSVGKVDKKCTAEKLAVGIFAGGLLGSRIMLMLTSSAQLFFSAMVVGALLLPYYLFQSKRLYAAPSLPLAEIDPRFQE